MKKVVRMLGLCALVALAFTACKKNDNTNKVTFKATITQPTTEGRTHINDVGQNQLVWDNGDEIEVYNKLGEHYTFTANTANQMTTVFDVPEDKADFLANIGTSNEYTAFYPNVIPVENDVKLVIEATQGYRVNSFSTETYPMYATNNGDNFEFHSNAGGLCVLVDRGSGNDVTVGSVVLSCPGDNLAGTLVYSSDYPIDPTAAGAKCEVELGSTTDMVTIDCGAEGTTVRDDPKWFYFVLLEGALDNKPFTVTFKDLNGNDIKSFSAVGSELNKIVAEKIIQMPPKSFNIQ